MHSVKTQVILRYPGIILNLTPKMDLGENFSRDLFTEQ